MKYKLVKKLIERTKSFNEETRSGWKHEQDGELFPLHNFKYYMDGKLYMFISIGYGTKITRHYNGTKDGIRIEYSRSGNIMYKCNILNGRPDGYVRQYNNYFEVIYNVYCTPKYIYVEPTINSSDKEITIQI